MEFIFLLRDIVDGNWKPTDYFSLEWLIVFENVDIFKNIA